MDKKFSMAVHSAQRELKAMRKEIDDVQNGRKPESILTSREFYNRLARINYRVRKIRDMSHS